MKILGHVDVTPYDDTDYGSAMSGSMTVDSGCSSLDFGYTSSTVGSYVSIPYSGDFEFFITRFI